jgi:hypothetical protein
MAVIATVSAASISTASRLDSEYFKPGYLALSSRLGKLATESTTALCDVSDGNHASVSEHFSSDPSVGPRYLRGQDIGGFFLGDANPVYIPHSIYDSLQRSHMQPRDVLLSIVGTIGLLSLVPKDAPPLTGSCKIAILRPRLDRISSEYLAAFLASRYGQFQIHRQTRGAVQMGFILEDMRFIRVARLGKAELAISENVEKAYIQACKAKALYASAQRILEQELGLDNINFSHRTGYETSLSETLQARRWDPQHYRPKYKALLDAIPKAPGYRLLRDMVSYNLRGLQPEYVPDGPIAVVNSQHIGSQHLAYDQFERTSEAAFASAGRAHIRKNDVLIYTTGAYVGRTNVFLEDMRAVASNHVNIIRLRPEYDAAYVGLVLNSPVGLLQTEKHATGSTQAELYPSAIAKFFVPLLKPKMMIAIGDKVRASYVALCEARQLLEQAKRRVEELIEQKTAR